MLRLLAVVVALAALPLPATAYQRNAEVQEEPNSDPATELWIDVAALTAGDSTVTPVAPGSYRVRVVNLAPGRNYTVLLSVQATPIDPLDLQPRPLLMPPSGGVVDSTCTALQAELTRAESVTDEKAVPAALARLRPLTAGCNDMSDYEELIARTERVFEPINVKKSQTLTIRVIRSDESARWARSYTTGGRGAWRRTYGFNFIYTGLASNPRYFTEAGATAGTFVIQQERTRELFELAPSLFYTWMPADADQRRVVHSPTLGLGFDFEAPVVSLGYAATFRENLSFSAGLSAHQVRRLNGRYSVGDVLTEIIGDEDLNRSVYRINPYFAVTIRSLSNPFQLGSDDDN